MSHHHPHHGLAEDIGTMLHMPASRRQLLRWLFAGTALQIAEVTGSVAHGFTATLTVGVSL